MHTHRRERGPRRHNSADRKASTKLACKTSTSQTIAVDKQTNRGIGQLQGEVRHLQAGYFRPEDGVSEQYLTSGRTTLRDTLENTDKQLEATKGERAGITRTRKA